MPEFNPGGGLGLLVPPRNPARLPAGMESGLIEMLLGPVQQAGQALRGQLTDAEAQDFAMMAAMGMLPMGRGMKVGANTVDDLLKSIGIPFRKEASRFQSEALGPSGSVYYKVETPQGPRQIRVSDHDAPTGTDALHFKYGDDTAALRAAVEREFGNIPPEFHQQTRGRQMQELERNLADAQRRLAEQEAAGRVYDSTRREVAHWLKELGRK